MSAQTSHRAFGVTFLTIGFSFLVIGIAGQTAFTTLGAAFMAIGLVRLAKSHKAR